MLRKAISISTFRGTITVCCHRSAPSPQRNARHRDGPVVIQPVLRALSTARAVPCRQFEPMMKG
jgi:hypothetical protein